MPADTQQQDVDQVVDGKVEGTQDVQDTTDGSGSDSYFLEVDDRTKYRTAEDAQKAYREAGERIAQLSEWDKAIGKVYDASPQQVAAALEEYVQLKEAQAQAEAAAKGKSAGEQATHTDDVQLTPKELEAFKWLQKVSPKLGYVPKAELDAIKAELEELRGGVSEQSQARLDSQVETGEGTLRTWIKDAKLPDNPEFAEFISDSVAAYFNRSAQRQEAWFKGGAQAQTILKEAFDYVVKNLGYVRGAAKPTYSGSNKGSTTVKRLPQVGSTLGKGTTGQQKQAPKLTPKEIHEKAFALAQSKWNGTAGDNGE
jgi:hypothetical protein